MTETGTALQRAEEKIIAIKPANNLSERIDKVFDAIAKRAYEMFDSKGRRFGHEVDDWLKAEMELVHPVHVEINESGENLEMKAEVPGFSEKELEISVEPQRLTIIGQRECNKEEKKGKTLYSEACCNQVLKVVELPMAINTEKVTATLKNGILELTMPKAAKGKTIEITPRAA